jgi:hypothetical protein
MAPDQGRGYRRRMQANFLTAGVLMLLMGLARTFLGHDLWFGVAAMAMGIVMIAIHVVDVRRAKRDGQAGNFD